MSQQKRKSVSLSGELYEKLRQHCDHWHVSMSGLVESIMRSHLGMDQKADKKVKAYWEDHQGYWTPGEIESIKAGAEKVQEDLGIVFGNPGACGPDRGQGQFWSNVVEENGGKIYCTGQGPNPILVSPAIPHSTDRLGGLSGENMSAMCRELYEPPAAKEVPWDEAPESALNELGEFAPKVMADDEDVMSSMTTHPGRRLPDPPVVEEELDKLREDQEEKREQPRVEPPSIYDIPSADVDPTKGMTETERREHEKRERIARKHFTF